MTGKTKAAMPGRQCNTALLKHRQITRLAAGGQTLCVSTTDPQINCVRFTYGHRDKHEQYSGSVQNNVKRGSEVPTNNVESCCDAEKYYYEENQQPAFLHDGNRLSLSEPVNQPSLRGETQRLCGSLRPAQNLQVTKSHQQNSSGVAQNRPEIIGAVDYRQTTENPAVNYKIFVVQNSTYEIFVGHSITGSNPVQPFGSMPRLFNSALPNSFSQLARLTPSCLASLSNCSFNSGGMRIWNAGALPVPLGCLSRLMIVDMCVPIAVVFFQIGTHLITMLSIKTTPPNGITSTERGLTTTVSESNEAAMKDHITHPQGRKSYIWRFLALSAIGRNVIHITATTEREAREQSPAGCVMVFAGRLPVREVRHA